MGVCTSAPEDLSNSSSRPRSDPGPRKRSPSRREIHSAPSSLESPTGLPGTAPGFSTPPYNTNFLHPQYNSHYAGTARMNLYHTVNVPQAYAPVNYSAYNGFALPEAPVGTAHGSSGGAPPPPPRTDDNAFVPLPAVMGPPPRAPAPAAVPVAVTRRDSTEPELPRVPPPPPPPLTAPCPTAQDSMGDDMSTTALSLDNYSFLDSKQASPARQHAGRTGGTTDSATGGDGISITSEYSMQNYIVDMLYAGQKKKNGFGSNSTTANNSANANPGVVTAAAPHSRTPSEVASQSSTALSVDDNFVNLCKKENINNVNINQLNEELHMKLVARGLANDGPQKYAMQNANSNFSARRATAPPAGFNSGGNSTAGSPNSNSSSNGSPGAQQTPGLRRRSVSFLGEVR